LTEMIVIRLPIDCGWKVWYGRITLP